MADELVTVTQPQRVDPAALVERMAALAAGLRPAEEIPERLHVGAEAWEMLRAIAAQHAGRPVPDATHMLGVPVVVGTPYAAVPLSPRGWALISAAGTVMSQGVLGDA